MYYQQSMPLVDLGGFIICIAVALLLVIIIAGIARTRRSKDYRMFLTDMYVSAKIRLLAEKDGLKITEEEESFKVWSKKDRVKTREYKLDDAVEDDLIERIEEPIKKAK